MHIHRPCPGQSRAQDRCMCLPGQTGRAQAPILAQDELGQSRCMCVSLVGRAWPEPELGQSGRTTTRGAGLRRPKVARNARTNFERRAALGATSCAIVYFFRGLHGGPAECGVTRAKHDVAFVGVANSANAAGQTECGLTRGKPDLAGMGCAKCAMRSTSRGILGGPAECGFTRTKVDLRTLALRKGLSG